MTFSFWKCLFGLHRKSDESPKEKNNTYNIYIYICILLSLVIYSLSKIVILHGLLESPNKRKCYQFLVCCVLTIKKQ